jgi:hypothetical protein
LLLIDDKQLDERVEVDPDAEFLPPADVFARVDGPQLASDGLTP